MHIPKDPSNVSRVGGCGVVKVTVSFCHIGSVGQSAWRFLGHLHKALPNELPSPFALQGYRICGSYSTTGQIKGGVVRKVFCGYPVAIADLLLHQVLFVQEANDSSTSQHSVVPDTVEHLNGLHQAICGLLLTKTLVKVTAGDDEQQCFNAIEHMNPLASLLPLSTHVKHTELLRVGTPWDLNLKANFIVTGGYGPTVQDVFCGGTVAG